MNLTEVFFSTVVYLLIGVVVTSLYARIRWISYENKSKGYSDSGNLGIGVLFWPVVTLWLLVKVMGVIVNDLATK